MDIKSCPYCGKPAQARFGYEIYPDHPTEEAYWRCDDCDAHAKMGSRTTMANRNLRRLRVAAHDAFDPLWMLGFMTRTETYIWLANTLGVTKERAHIGLMDSELCWKTIHVCAEKLNVLNNKG